MKNLKLILVSLLVLAVSSSCITHKDIATAQSQMAEYINIQIQESNQRLRVERAVMKFVPVVTKVDLLEVLKEDSKSVTYRAKVVWMSKDGLRENVWGVYYNKPTNLVKLYQLK